MSRVHPGRLRAFASIVVACCALTPPVAATDDPLVLEGRVVGVSDGDTLTLLVGSRDVKIRLAQIDAPELRQPYGRKAKTALSQMAFGKEARVEVVDTDRYGRSVGEVFVDGEHINQQLVRQGHAWAYTQYSRSIEIVELEDEARAAVRGLWQLPEDQRDAPWVWRHSPSSRAGAAPAVVPADPSTFSCGAKHYCTQMTSCAEARFHWSDCGLSQLDGDGDDIPCESLCRAAGPRGDGRR